MEQILIVEDDSFLNKMVAYNPVSYTHLDVYKRQFPLSVMISVFLAFLVSMLKQEM